MDRYSWIVIETTLVLWLVIGRVGYAATYSGGEGTPDNPWQIANVTDWTTLCSSSADWDNCFVLISDINFEGVPVKSVGNESTFFTGKLDGRGHVLSNIRIVKVLGNDVGVFEFIGSSGNLCNIILENVFAKGWGWIGGLVGNNYGNIVSCAVTGVVVGSAFYAGGLAGYSSGDITSCCSTAEVTGEEDVGGLVGWNDGDITSSYTTSDVTGELHVGGLVGWNRNGTVKSCHATGAVKGGYPDYGGSTGGLIGVNEGLITLSYSTGAVTGDENVGGLVGLNHKYITSCYARGEVKGDRQVGGLTAYIHDGGTETCYATGRVRGNYYVGGFTSYMTPFSSVTSCYWDVNSSMRPSSYAGTGRTTDEMTYPYATNTYINWNFSDVWRADTDYSLNQGYPYLRSNLPAPVLLSITPLVRCVGATSDQTTFTILTKAAWTALTSDTWIILSPASGTGDSTLTVTYSANTDASLRQGTVTIMGVGTTPFSVALTIEQSEMPREGEDDEEGEPSSVHPGDLDGDWRMTMSECILYLSAWQQGGNPMSHAIRATYLWQNGEYYTYDEALTPPLCWTLKK